MIVITDKSKKIKAYLHNNIILVPGTLEVLGVILGSCVFGKDGKAKGKYFHKKFYSTSGEIVGMDYGSFDDKTIDTNFILNEGWKLITSITNHNCPWIYPLEKWSSQEIVQLLKEPSTETEKAVL
jgi:hypothetical protein